MSASDDGTIKLWDIESNECIKTYQANIGIVSCVKYVATGNKMINGYFNDALKIWNMENDECIKTIDRSHTREIRNILIISNNKFVTCSLDQTIKLLAKLSKNTIASCQSSNYTIEIWNTDSGNCLEKLSGHKNLVTFIDLF